MDVIDFLKSEKVEAMSLTCVGAYTLLLCEAWTRPCCSLPSARLQGGLSMVKKLARWTGTDEEFEPVLACFEPLKGDKTRMINPRLKREWDETHTKLLILSEAGKRGAEIKKALHEKKPTASKRIRIEPTNDFEQFWQAYPKKIGKKAALQAWEKAIDKPAVVDIIKALDIANKSEQWTKDNGQFIPNPSTWLNQGRWTDQPLSNGHGVSLTCALHPHLTFTDKHAKDTHDYIHHPKYVG